MDIWWSALTVFDKILWGIAVFSSVTFLIQTILTFIGVGHHDADISMVHDFQHDTGTDSDGLEGSFFVGYFTIRNMIAFLLGFSWGGLVFTGQQISKLWVILGGTIIGLVFVIAVMGIMKGLSKLISSGTISLNEALGKEGTVAIMIPGKMKGRGKVNVSIRGKLMDLAAISREEETLKRGQQVKIIDLSNEQLIVEKIS
jgi:hypothetical protein